MDSKYVEGSTKFRSSAFNKKAGDLLFKLVDKGVHFQSFEARNSLMGNIASSRFENAKKTGSLQLSNLKLKKVPDSVKKLISLRILDLSNNSLQELEPWIGLLENLKVLNISENKLEYLPAELSLLSKLETLNASNNQMTSFINPPNVVNLNSLRHLRTIDLSNNKIPEFPLELCSNDIPLDLLDLSKNDITVIPDCTSSLQVIELNLCENKISVISESLAKCPRLKVLRLAQNQILQEDLPLALLESSNISLFSIEGNPLSLRALQELPAYAKYMERYTAAKRKAMP